jgi:hypothetical protein
MTSLPYVPTPPLDPAARRSQRLALAGMITLGVSLALVWGSTVGVTYTPGYSYSDASGYIYYVPGMWTTGGTYVSYGYQSAGRVWVVSAVLLTILGRVRQKPRLLYVAAGLPVLGLVTSKPALVTVAVVLVGAALLVMSSLRRGRTVPQQSGQY